MKEKINKNYHRMEEIAIESEKLIIELLKENDGFILTSNKECDTIYGYRYDCDGTLVEERINAIILERGCDDNYYISVNMDNPIINYTSKEDVFADENTLYALFGGDVLGVFTMYNILECIHEYV